ncbi:Pentatricopeptide repeat-containing protein [Apostasia shenzhenica]|uniref:Pentatricopeptide repeat-containing protein n=1 Tax=Apostasia shenzhenica TaxID=1088818 RepID=A0A2I0A650_9ASPA|nr:Pentatricopeptide repeat-containing protein [Apostasia shenzhenica]
MDSSRFFRVNRLKTVLRVARLLLSSSPLAPAAAKSYCSKTSRPPRRRSLAAIVYPLGHPSINLSPELDRWVADGNPLRIVEIQNLVRDLRRRRRHKQALELNRCKVSEWMKTKRNAIFMASDHAVHLDLIGEVHGVSAAENYFKSLMEKDKNEKTYGALLNCYVRERLINESLSHLEKMKVMGLASSSLPYNNIMCLYTTTGQHEKVPPLLAEMKESMVMPDNFSYRLCINSYGTRSDIEGMEKVLEEMALQPQIVVDWNTYSVVANIYIRALLIEKAISALRKAEGKLEKKNGLCYNHLISLYGAIGNKAEIWRLWKLQKENMKLVNRDYTTMLQALVKLGEIEEAEELIKEWESSGNSFDFRVPNVLLVGYRKKGTMEKAEVMLDEFLSKGKAPPSSSWGIVATGFAEKGEMSKAYEFMTSALCVYKPSSGWEPNSNAIRSILHYIADEVDAKNVETFVDLLKNVVPLNGDIYHTLIKSYIRAGAGIEKLLESMKSKGIEPNEETLEIIASFK